MAAVNAIDEARSELQEKKDEIERLETEWDGKRFDEVTRNEYNLLNEQHDEIVATIDELERRQARREALAAKEENIERIEPPQVHRPGAVSGEDIWDIGSIQRSWDSPEVEDRQFHDRALRAIERAHFPHPKADKEDVQGHLELLLGDGEGGDRKGSHVARHFLYTGSPQYKRAFTKALAQGGQGLSESEHKMLQRAMSLTAASGGYAVPFVLDPTVIPTSSGAVNPYRAISDVSTITVDEWRGVSADDVTSAFQAEAAATTDNSPTLAQPVVSTEMGRAFIPFSIEIGMDWASFQSDMARLIQGGKDTLEATKFALGGGTNEPFGIITGATTVFTASNTNSLVVADIYGVHNALGPRFRENGVWAMNNSVSARIRQLDTTGGANLWIDNLQLPGASSGAATGGSVPAALLGHRVYEASGQSGAFTTGQLIAVFGDFGNYYKIVDRIGLTMEVVPHLFGAAQGNLPTGQRGLLAYWRTGGKAIHANAFRTLKLA